MISSERSNSQSEIPDHKIFNYSSMEFHVLRLWTVVTLKISSAEREFRTSVAYDVKQLTHTTHAGDLSHSSVSPIDHLIDGYAHLIHFIQHMNDAVKMFFNYTDHMSVTLQPFDHQYVRVCYHGPRPTTTFSVTLEKEGKIFDIKHLKFLLYFISHQKWHCFYNN